MSSELYFMDSFIYKYSILLYTLCTYSVNWQKLFTSKKSYTRCDVKWYDVEEMDIDMMYGHSRNRVKYYVFPSFHRSHHDENDNVCRIALEGMRGKYWYSHMIARSEEYFVNNSFYYFDESYIIEKNDEGFLWSKCSL